MKIYGEKTMKQETELMPCPFCGGEACMEGKHPTCEMCGAMVGNGDVERWNTRAQPAIPGGYTKGQYTDEEYKCLKEDYECLKEDYEELDGFFNELIELSGAADGSDGGETFYSAQDVADAFREKFSAIPDGYVLVPNCISQKLLNAGISAFSETEAFECLEDRLDSVCAVTDIYDAFIEAAKKEHGHG